PMAGLIDVLLLMLNLIVTPLIGPPTFLFVRNLGPVRGERSSVELIAPGLAQEPLGGYVPVKSFKSIKDGGLFEKLYRVLTNHPYIIGVYVDLNRVSIDGLVKTLALIRKDWPPRRKARIVFRLAW